MLNNK
jgi:hypothetical protein